MSKSMVFARNVLTIEGKKLDRIQQKNSAHKFDWFAMVLSGICAIHCIALPVLAGVLPIFSSLAAHDHGLHSFWFHQLILFFIFPISVIALWAGFRCHRKIYPVLVSGIGLSVLLFSALYADVLIIRYALPHEIETVLTLSGGVVHAVGHIMNLMASRGRHACEHIAHQAHSHS